VKIDILETSNKQQSRQVCILTQLVYRLYGLTEEEIGIVEGNLG